MILLALLLAIPASAADIPGTCDPEAMAAVSARRRQNRGPDPVAELRRDARSLRDLERSGQRPAVETLPSPGNRELLERDLRSLTAVGRDEVAELATSEAFRRSGWAEGRITGRSSRSPLKMIHGRELGVENLERQVYWPRNPDGSVNTKGVRVAVNRGRVDGAWADISMEVLAPAPGGGWRPLLFERENGAWVPAATFRNKPLMQACALCHRTREAEGVLTGYAFIFQDFFRDYPEEVKRAVQAELAK